MEEEEGGGGKYERMGIRDQGQTKPVAFNEVFLGLYSLKFGSSRLESK